MKTNPFRATGEAMPSAASATGINTGVTIYELEASADALSLIAVCGFTAQRIADGDEDAMDLAGDVARALRWARSLAQQTHHAIEMAERIGRTGEP